MTALVLTVLDGDDLVVAGSFAGAGARLEAGGATPLSQGRYHREHPIWDSLCFYPDPLRG